MSHVFLYAHGTSVGPDPTAALEVATGHMADTVSELELTHTFVVVHTHSHAVTPVQVSDPPGTRARPGFTVTITTVAEVSK
ncbi:hypothetical protein CH267_00170 [Rhodococcus sp. 06-621-2]|nr:hypothetical protein [Rhodococcus sp. 06-621-2]OZC62809.1 hypothetical protein CH267_00170 [Rhodococcus sp. 06-621-2]